MEERHEKEIARIKEELQREVTLVLIICLLFQFLYYISKFHPIFLKNSSYA